MRILFWVFTACLTSFTVPVNAADEDTWHLERDRDGIQIYSRPVAGWDIHEIRGVTRIPVRLASVVAVLVDTTVSHELTEVVDHSEIERRDSDTHYQFYSVTNLPWPVSDRDILYERHISQDDHSLAVTIDDSAVDGVVPRRKGLVRIVKSHQQWTVTPMADGGVIVENRVLSDPSGPIPTTLINALSVNTPFRTLANLKQIVLRPQYRYANLPFIKDPATKNPDRPA